MNIVILLATIGAASVEWVEALTIVLAVGLYKGWRSALLGLALGLAVLAGLTLVLGLTLITHLSLPAVRTLVGALLLLFGLKWLHKAILRSSGLMSLHDEARAFAQAASILSASGRPLRRLDRIGVATSFGGVLLEGLEVVFIVVSLGGLQNLPAATLGALSSLLLVSAAGVIFRHPLTRVPENPMKYVVGILLTSFGTFFTGEGIGVHWWGSDLSLLALVAIYAFASLLFVQALRHPVRLSARPHRLARALRIAGAELWGLFVDDGGLALVAILAVLLVALFVTHYGDHYALAGALLIAGVLLAVWIGLRDATRDQLPGPRQTSAPEPTPRLTPQNWLDKDSH